MTRERERNEATTPARHAVALAWACAVLAAGCGESAGSQPGSGGVAGSGAVSGAGGGASGSSAGAGEMGGTSSSGGAGTGGAAAGIGGARGGAAGSVGGSGAAAGSAGTPAGGTAAAGGESGSGAAGAGGGGGSAGGGATGACVDVSQVDGRQRDDLQAIGTGFDAYEGQTIRILATHGEPTYGLGEAPIRDGAFDIFLPGVLGDYTGLAVHVDTIRNSSCDPDDEFIWQMTTGPAPGDTVWQVTPDSLMVFDQGAPCSLNGIFDLTTPLPCPAQEAAGLYALVDGVHMGDGQPAVTFQNRNAAGASSLRVSVQRYPLLAVQVRWPDGAAVPGTFSGDDAILSFTESGFGQSWFSNREGGSSSVTVTVAGTRIGERMVGTFSGTLATDESPDDVRVVTEGWFDVVIVTVN